MSDERKKINVVLAPKISIITVCYNAETLIERTIQSVLGQTYANIEHVIVDGNSTDKTMDIVRGVFSKKTVETQCIASLQIVSEPDTGIYDAMNKGLALTTGDYVWFINAGDEIYEPTTLENLMPFFEQNADVIYGDTVRVDEGRNVLGLREKRPPKTFTWKSFRMGMSVCHQSILIRKTIAPTYDLNYKITADIDWIIRVMKQAKNVCNSHQVLSRFLIGGFSKQREKQSWKERFAIMKKHYGLLQTLIFHVFISIRFLFK